jgi:hypothetical protein
MTEYRYIGKDGKPILARDLEDQRDELQDKLTKAVNALRELVTCVDDGCYCSELKMAAVVDDAIATLAEIKGET